MKSSTFRFVFIFLLFFIQTLFVMSTEGSCYDSLNLASKNGHLYANNQRVYLKALSWFGCETSLSTFHGLWAQDYKTLLNFIKNYSFNAMRVPFSLDMVLKDPNPQSINFYNMNADLKGLTALQVLDKVVDEAGKRGILIMLDLHSFEPDAFMSNGLWYDSTHPESLVLKGWDMLIQRYNSTWNVVAFDLKNEPHSTTWNTGNLATDWDAAATRIGNHILTTGGEKFLLFVEGTASSPPCNQSCFWGEDLTGVKQKAIKLVNQEKLVYSPHVYGPSVSYQPYFSDPSFPKNMPAIWDDHWAFIPNLTGNAIVIGEWGGIYSGQDGIWMDAIVDYLKGKDLTDQFFWCLNPDSGDTGGLLLNDWITPEVAKLTLLQKLVPNPTVFTPTTDGKICIYNKSN